MDILEGKVENWWADLVKQARDKGIRITTDEVERIWRRVQERVRDTIKPSDPKFNATIMLKTKKLVLKEDKIGKFDQYLTEKFDDETLEKDKFVLEDTKCPECDNWFFQPTKKEKIYCNNRCASRHIVRKKRLEQKEANPKLHAEEKVKEAGR